MDELIAEIEQPLCSRNLIYLAYLLPEEPEYLFSDVRDAFDKNRHLPLNSTLNSCTRISNALNFLGKPTTQRRWRDGEYSTA